jgi:tetratricopeptide (TPR) repeat protein
MPASRGLAFVGRKRERELLDGVLAKARRGQSAVLVIRGDPGIGKTSLLRYTARQASGFRVAQIAGVQAEMELPFAGIHQLCAPMFDRVGALVEPQRKALEVALGVAPGEPPQRFLIAMAVLSLVSAVTDDRPLLCLVDDVHWMDAESGQVLGFVARRVFAESVAIVFAVRKAITVHALADLPELQLGGLDEADARVILSKAAAGRLDHRVRDRIIAETRGNPLALLELTQTMSAVERAGGYVPPGGQGVPDHIEEQYSRRIAELPPATQQLLLLAAAEPLGEATLLWRAAERLSIDATTATAAAAAGLLEIDDKVRFRHPLVRSAVYRGASVDARRHVHDALAAVSDQELDADRRAWHRALSASGPDESVAAELERSAERAQSRGGLAAAAAFLERATALSSDPAAHARRALAAAEVSFHAGAFETALGLVASAEAHGLDDLRSARATLLRARVAFALRDAKSAAQLFLRAAAQLEPLDLTLARRGYLSAWGAAVAAGDLGGRDVLREICRAVRALPPLGDAPHPLDLLLDGLALLTTGGRVAATPILLRAARAVACISPEDVLRWGLLAPSASSATWDSEGLTAILERQAQIVRDAGALAELPVYLSALALDKAWSGDFASASLLIAESDRVADVSGGRILSYAQLGLWALQGREAEASELIERTVAEAEAAGAGEAAKMAHWAAAVMFNGFARYDQAVAASRRVLANAVGPWNTVWVLPELVEAATRIGETDLARDAFERLVDSTQPAGTALALGIEARSRALLSEGTAAEDLYREAVDRLGLTRRRPELARAHLLFGESLRHEGHDVRAREQLKTASDIFGAIGMEAFGERARRELLAAGGQVRSRTSEARDELTPHEEQIARLARDGLTNAEIGGQLFLSSRTVEWALAQGVCEAGNQDAKWPSGRPG